MVLGGGAVVTAGNPVQAALRLVLVFCNAAGLRRLLQVDFRALIFLIVYVGAVRVLFLFVVRRLNVQPLARADRSRARVRPRAVAVATRFRGERYLVRGEGVYRLPVSTRARVEGGVAGFTSQDWAAGGSAGLRLEGRTDIQALGQVLYTDYALPFLTAGVVLLVARVGAIVLTRTTPTPASVRPRRQQVDQQRSRSVSKAVFRCARE